MNLVIDIGNTRVKLYTFDGSTIADKTYSDSNTLAELDGLLERFKYKKAIISSVASIGTEAEQRLKAMPVPLTYLDDSTKLPVDIVYRKPGSSEGIPMPVGMGADRIAAIVAAKMMQPNTPLLIVDAGTCITYEFIDGEGYYMGGNIAPGTGIRAKGMHEHTALLPLIDCYGETPIMGYDTETAMRCGVMHGVKYEIEGYIKQWSKHFPNLTVFMTGGDGMTFDADIKDRIHIEPDLVAKGLNYIL